MNIPYTKQTLANGLDLIVHEDHTCPIVAVNVWYHVGSKNEQPGHTGFAHLFEHLMFEGSKHYDRGYFHPLQEAGALLNGSTNTDRTNYWEVVPINALDLALWMESDRMAYLLPALTQKKFENQRDVVLNERRQNYENRPYGFAGMVLASALYSSDHPYHWLPIGLAEDLQVATLEDVHHFFTTYYHPSNASLTFAGAVDTDYALSLAQQYFGQIESGPKPLPFDDGLDEIGVSSGIRLMLEDRVELPRLYLAWRTPALFNKCDAELDLIGDILANGKSSRLYRALVYDRKIATDVTAGQSSRELSSFFCIAATASPGHDLGELDYVISEEIDRLIEDGPSSEDLQRSLTQIEAQFVYRLSTVGGFGGKSDQLNAYNVFTGNPGFFGLDLARYQDVSVEHIRTAASTYISRGQRIVLSVVPYGQRELAITNSKPASVS